MADEEGRLSSLSTKHELIGYDRLNLLYAAYREPLLLLGPEGLGKRTWCEQKAEDYQGVVYTTDNKAPQLRHIQSLYASPMPFMWVLEVVDFKGPHRRYDLLSSVLKSAPSHVTVLAHASFDPPQIVKDSCSVYSVPLLTNEQIMKLCQQQNYAPDEAEFAVRAANGIPGDALGSFEVLRSRLSILNALECVRDDNYSGLNTLIDRATPGDIRLLHSILRGFETGEWVFFTEGDIEPLRRVTGLMENVLYNYPRATPSTVFGVIFTAAQHAYHGRV